MNGFTVPVLDNSCLEIVSVPELKEGVDPSHVEKGRTSMRTTTLFCRTSRTVDKSDSNVYIPESTQMCFEERSWDTSRCTERDSEHTSVKLFHKASNLKWREPRMTQRRDPQKSAAPSVNETGWSQRNSGPRGVDSSV